MIFIIPVASFLIQFCTREKSRCYNIIIVIYPANIQQQLYAGMVQH